MDVDVLANVYRPVFYLHKDEEYYPVTMKYAFQQCELVRGNDVIVPYPNLEPTSPQLEAPDSESMSINIVNRAKAVLSAKRQFQENNVPIFYFVNKYYSEQESGSVAYADIVYYVQYLYNGSIFLFPRISKIGEHDWDAEVVILRVRLGPESVSESGPESGSESGSGPGAEPRVEGVWLSQHSGGKWFDYDKMEKDPLTKRMVVYVARNSHAHDHRPRTIWRMFGFSNDVTRKDIRWAPELATNNKLPNAPVWTRFKGTLSGRQALVHQRSALQSTFTYKLGKHDTTTRLLWEQAHMDKNTARYIAWGVLALVVVILVMLMTPSVPLIGGTTQLWEFGVLAVLFVVAFLAVQLLQFLATQ